MMTIMGNAKKKKTARAGPVRSNRPSVPPPYFLSEVVGDAHLTPQEKNVLRVLICLMGRVVNQKEIWERMYSHREDGGPYTKIIDVYISRIKPLLLPGWEIKNIWGRGHTLTLEGCDEIT